MPVVLSHAPQYLTMYTLGLGLSITQCRLGARLHFHCTVPLFILMCVCELSSMPPGTSCTVPLFILMCVCELSYMPPETLCGSTSDMYSYSLLPPPLLFSLFLPSSPLPPPPSRPTQACSVLPSTLTATFLSTQNRSLRCSRGRGGLRCLHTSTPSQTMPTPTCCRIGTTSPSSSREGRGGEGRSRDSGGEG